MNTPKIEDFMNMNIDGWEKVYFPNFDSFFYNAKDKIQVLASIKKDIITNIDYIHVSIGYLKSECKNILTETELNEGIYDKIPEILYKFFGIRLFERKQEDPKNPLLKHYISVI